MSWDGLEGSAVTYADSPAESRRFGLRTARLTVGWNLRPDGTVGGHDEVAGGPGNDTAAAALDRAAADITDLLTSAEADVVVVRYPAQSLRLAAAVARSGREVLPAGSLTYWSARAAEVVQAVPEATEALSVLPLAAYPGGEQERAAVVDAVVADSFGGYGNHYSANPLLEPGAALAGYQEWARSSALGDPDDALLLLLDGEVVGLATLVDGEEPGGHVEVLLAGLRTAAQGRGRYGTLLGGVALEAQARGRHEMVISTQSHNVRVQRAWARLGLRPFAAVETVHAVRPGLLG